MSSSRPIQSSSSRSKHNARIIAQTTIDAKLHSEYEKSGGSSFDYSRSVTLTSTQSTPDQNQPPPPRSDKVTTTAYLHQIQKLKLIQPFGCLLALDEKTFRVIAYSENAPEMLTMVSQAVPSDALRFPEVSLLNPILIHYKASGKPFYAILHRVTGSLIIDFEPVKPDEVPMTAAGALQSYKLAAKAIVRLQSLPSGSVERLCDTVVQEVFELTGYDRVMVYKFHEDDHGEFVSEVTKPGLESYLVRMICDRRAKHVKVIQDDKLPFDLTLCGSILRAPHSCHLEYMKNMDSGASLVMAVVINDCDEEEQSGSRSAQPQKRKRLWGLVVCHHTTPRFVPFPLRYACEFLTQVFAIHVSKEFELENQMVEKNILRTQTLLCDMLMRDAPLGIVLQNPNIMDLVKCDGAALFYKNKIWRLGMTPSDFQIHDIASWLSEYHADSTSTDSLYDAGYPGALSLGDAVCGMAAVRITSKDMLFWFRSHTAADIRWEKNAPLIFIQGIPFEVVKTRSAPWRDFEMNVIHSLQLILRNTFSEIDAKDDNPSVLIHSKLNDLKLEGMEELRVVTNELVRLMETATVPVLAVDVDGLINGWNTKIADLTGLPVDQVLGQHLLTPVEDSSVIAVEKMLHLALQGKEEQNVHFEMKTHGSRKDYGPVSLVVNACASKDIRENVVGVCFVAQDLTTQKMAMDKFTRIQGDYKTIVQNPSALIPPIFGQMNLAGVLCGIQR
ncbi:hypothetical protein MKX01_028181 [Papaver californicum]|nr:hypothetical protein MKX01_028181 [Papaver californicum]